MTQTIGVAIQHKIEPEALLAVVQTESAGKSLEIDGKTPCLLFERHIFYRELNKRKPEKLGAAVGNGLANSSWQPSTQYKDQGTSSKRLELFRRACAIDRECAIRSCSWGVGQTMGFLAEEMKFKNGIAMFDYMVAGGVPAQVECMVREIENKKLTAKLNGHQWASFARVYNGPGYAKNRYDTKMAAAYAMWKDKGLSHDTPPPKPVVVPPDTKPTGPVTPPAPVPGGPAAAGGIGAFLAAIVAFFKGLDPALIAFGVFMLALVIATVLIIWQRKRHEKEQTGVFSNIAASEPTPQTGGV